MLVGAHRERFELRRFEHYGLRHRVEKTPERPGKGVGLTWPQYLLHQVHVMRLRERLDQPARGARELSSLREMHQQNPLHVSGLSPRRTWTSPPREYPASHGF